MNTVRRVLFTALLTAAVTPAGVLAQNTSTQSQPPPLPATSSAAQGASGGQGSGAAQSTGVDQSGTGAVTTGGNQGAGGTQDTSGGKATSASGYTSAQSAAGGHRSPMEPLLFAFILIGGGIIAWVAANATDRYVRRHG